MLSDKTRDHNESTTKIIGSECYQQQRLSAAKINKIILTLVHGSSVRWLHGLDLLNVILKVFAQNSKKKLAKTEKAF